MNNTQKIKAMRQFKDAIHGWTFSNLSMASSRLAAGQEAFKGLPDELKGEAMETLNSIASHICDLYDAKKLGGK